EIQDSDTITISSQFQDPDFLQCLYCGEALPSPLPLKVSKYLNDIATKKKLAHTAVEQYEFCRVHREEGIIIPYRVEKGYPLHIDLQYYLIEIQAIGVSKANSLLLQINYFESFQPDYYGTKGLAIILKTLTEMFVQPKILTTNLCALQLSSQNLAQVLTPETAIRLIAKDFNNISLDMAKKIMIDSIEFGLY
ncbi:13039_t:CDS:2, partial [Gigaspora rosea]